MHTNNIDISDNSRTGVLFQNSNVFLAFIDQELNSVDFLININEFPKKKICTTFQFLFSNKKNNLTML